MAARSDTLKAMILLGINCGFEVGEFQKNYQAAIDEIEFPSLDQATADGIPRQQQELQRSVNNVLTLIEANVAKKVVSGARAVATLARRVAKTQLLSGEYVNRQYFINLFANAIVRPAFAELRKLDTCEDLAAGLLEEVTRKIECAETATTAEPRSIA